MDEKSTRALRNRGVTMVSVSPAHDYIDVRADVRLNWHHLFAFGAKTRCRMMTSVSVEHSVLA